MNHKLIISLLTPLLVLAIGRFLPPEPSGAPSSAAPPLRSVQSLPDVAVTKYIESGTVAPGHYVKYVVVFQNASLVQADDIFIRDTLPVSSTYISSTGPGLTPVQAGPDRVVWHKDRLAGFEMGWASITVRFADDAPVGATAVNNVRITTTNPESNLDNNEDIFPSEIRPPGPDLGIRKTLQSGIADGGNQISYHIHYNYTAPNLAPAQHVRITDTLPASTTYVSDVNDAGFTTIQVGDTVVWEKSAVAADSEGDLYLNVLIDDEFDANEDWLENVVEISTSDAETDVDNNLNRFVIKPEGDKFYGAAVTSVDDKTMQLLSEGGFDWLVYYLDWSKAEPSKNQYNWRYLDDAIWQAWRYHLKLAVRIDRAPAWARPPGSGETAPPTNPHDLRDFMDAIAGRTNVPAIEAYIIWNEPNLTGEWGGQPPDAAAYVELLQAAYLGVNGRGLVVSAGLATTNGNPSNAVDDRIYLQQMYDVPQAGDFFDRLGANPLGFASAPDDTSDLNGYYFRRAEEWRTIMQLNGDGTKKMFATEMGWLRDTETDLAEDYNWMKVSTIDQAHYLARAYQKARCEWPWMSAMTTWNLDFAGFYPETDHPYWFGLTDQNHSPLRAYLTLKNAARRGPADMWLETELISPAEPDHQVEVGDELVYQIHYTNIGGQPAPGIVLTDTLPNRTVYITDTKAGRPDNGKVVWDIGPVDPCTRETITLTLQVEAIAPVYTNTVKGNVLPAEPYTDDNVASVGVKGRGGGLYLPLILKDSRVGPDLVIDALTATSTHITVTIRNAGQTRVGDDFWVDVYFNPDREPPQVNQPWQTIALTGAVWGVTRSLAPNETLVLVTGGDYYFGPPDSSPPPFPLGANVYAYVDSVNFNTTYGNVQEINENNNVAGPEISAQGQSQSPSLAGQRPPRSEDLPER